MLKTVLDSMDGIPDALHEHYSEKDGSFVLDVEGVNVLTVRGLVSSNEKLKAKNTKLSARLQAMGNDPSGSPVTPEYLEELHNQLKNRPDEVATAERVAKIKADANQALADQVNPLKERNELYARQLQNATVNYELRAALVASKVRPELMSMVERSIIAEFSPQIEELSDGQVRAVFPVDQYGVTLAENRRPVGEWVEQYVAVPDNAHLIQANGSGGSGASPPGPGGGGGGRAQIPWGDLGKGDNASKFNKGELATV